MLLIKTCLLTRVLLRRLRELELTAENWDQMHSIEALEGGIDRRVHAILQAAHFLVNLHQFLGPGPGS